MEQNKSPEINPHPYSQVIYDKGRRIYNRVKTVSSTSDVGKIGQIHVKKETGQPFYTVYKNRLKMD